MRGEKNKTMLMVKVDGEAINCLDRVAAAGSDGTAQVMVRFFDGLQHSVQFLDGARGIKPSVIRDELAKLLLAQAPRASPAELQFVASIWARAAQLRAQEGGGEQ